MRVSTSEAVVVGAGHNGLVTAVLLAKAGWSVTVLERNDVPGGAVRTEEVTLPGFRHDLMAMSLNAFVGSSFFREHNAELREHGLELAAAPKAFGSIFPDGAFLGVSADHEETLASVRAVSETDAEAWQQLAARFGQTAPYLFELLTRPMPSASAATGILGGVRRLGRKWPLELSEIGAQSSREFVEQHFESRELHALIASWGMHLDLAPDLPLGALFAYLNAFEFAAHGLTIGRGGARTIIDALVSMLRAHGGELVTGVEAEHIVVDDGRAVAVLAGDDRYDAKRAVIANLTPQGLYSQLLADEDAVPEDIRRRAASYQYGPGGLAIHLALDDLPPWRAPQAREFAYVHVGPYLEEMGLSYQQAVAGVLPARPMIVVGQPTVADPTRAPDGKHVAWILVRMVPARIHGDAASQIDARDWDEVKEPYADRVLAILEQYAPGLQERILGRFVLSPVDLERLNPNLIDGEGLGGSHHPAQNFFMRPFPGWSRYRTPIDRLYMCGASTWPGAGTGAGSGYLLGKQLTRPVSVRARHFLRKRQRPRLTDTTTRAMRINPDARDGLSHHTPPEPQGGKAHV